MNSLQEEAEWSKVVEILILLCWAIWNVNVWQYFTYTNQQYYLTQSNTCQCSKSNVVKALSFRSLHQHTLAITHFIIGLPQSLSLFVMLKNLAGINIRLTIIWKIKCCTPANRFCGLYFNSKVPKMGRYYIITNLILLSSTM